MRKVFVVTGCSKHDSLGVYIANSIRNMIPGSIIIGVVEKPIPNDLIENTDSFQCFDEIYVCDISNPESISHLAEKIGIEYDSIYAFVNAAGIHEICWFQDVQLQNFDKIMRVNCTSIYLIVQRFLNLLKGGCFINITSNAAYNPMRCSMAYNASKAAAKMLLSQMARELTKPNDLTILSISPNKIEGTGMSKYNDDVIPAARGWSVDEAKKIQESALLAGKEIPPQCVSDFIAFLLSERKNHEHLSGVDIQYAI